MLAALIHTGVLTLSIFVREGTALSKFYNDKEGACEVPDRPYKGHLAPVRNEQVNFVLTTEDGEMAFEFEPSATYYLEVSSDTDLAEGSNAWMHASEGTIAPVDPSAHSQATACPQATFSLAPAPEHRTLWTAPATMDCVNITAALAEHEESAYYVNWVRVCPGESTSEAPSESPAMAPGPAEAPEEASSPQGAGGSQGTQERSLNDASSSFAAITAFNGAVLASAAAAAVVTLL